MRHGALAIFLSLSPFCPAEASTLFCTEPREPFCLSSIYDVRDTGALRSCEIEMDRFQQQSREYVQCLNSASRSALERANVIIERWNQLLDRR